MAWPKYRVRRATLDDIEALTALWHSMQFDAADLGRRATEFQLVEEAQGKLLGAVALQVAERQGLIHSEGFTDFGLADELRPLLWERLQALAASHGVLRLWTRERAPFWRQCGLEPPAPESLAKLPAAWRFPAATWLTLKVKDELPHLLSADKEFEAFMQIERMRTQRTMGRARLLKGLATFLAIVLFGLVLAGLFFVLSKNPRLLGR